MQGAVIVAQLLLDGGQGDVGHANVGNVDKEDQASEQGQETSVLRRWSRESGVLDLHDDERRDGRGLERLAGGHGG